MPPLKIFGKWVLAGEHTVLRGGVAIALPHPEFYLAFNFTPTSSPSFNVTPPKAASLLKELFKFSNIPLPQGNFEIYNSIPLSAGLGSSAALCIALTRWMFQENLLAHSDLFEHARKLENYFHGKSSGMDIAAILLQKPILFSMHEGAKPLSIQKLPHFTFHDTGLRSSTRDGIEKVEALQKSHPELCTHSDKLMQNAALLCYEGLLAYSAAEIHNRPDTRKTSLKQLQTGMQKAQEAFQNWGLVPPQAKKLADDLLGQGALAVKITGAGGGGFLVALWE